MTKRIWRNHEWDFTSRTIAEDVAKRMNDAPNVTGVKNAKAEQWPETGKWGITYEVK